MKGPRSNRAGQFDYPRTRVRTVHVPTVDMSDYELEELYIEYPNHPLGDGRDLETYVISGPLGKFFSDEVIPPGRYFLHIEEAVEWVEQTYGEYYERIRETEKYGKWAFRVKKGSYKQRDGIREVVEQSQQGRAIKFRVV